MILHLERKFTSPTEIYIADQINYQSEYESIVFTAKHLNNLKVNAKIFEFSGQSRLSLKMMNAKQVRFFKDLYAEKKPAIIHGHFLTDSSYFHPLTTKWNIPKVCSVYGYDVSRFPESFFGLGKHYIRRVFNEYDYMLAMSADMANDLVKLGCPQQKVKIHYHGIDTELFKVDREYGDKEVFHMLTIASLVPKKGHITVLKALAMLKKMHPKAKFLYTIAGKGPLLESLTKFAGENGLTENVQFKGHVRHGEDFLQLLKSADVFVHPSVTDDKGDKEGIPGTIVQAMASGLPVIATYHAGIPEVIKSGENGLLIAEKDSLKLAEYLNELFTDVKKRALLGSNAMDTALNQLDVRVKTRALESIYKGIGRV
jgi:colanic acid/amylovoran biosynthesis glycosyltransferase